MVTKVTTRIHEGIGWITLDGPDRLNAIGSHTYTALADAVRAFEGSAGVGVVIVHGSGRGFSAGADIEEISGFTERQQFADFVHGFTDALDVLAANPLPVIAAIHGPAMGGGLELSLACDIRIATPESLLGLPESKLAVLPGAGGTQRLPRLVPSGIATEMLMTGAPIDGTRAHQIGLVNHLAEADALLDRAAELASELLAIAPQVFPATKSLLHRTANVTVNEGIEIEREVAADLFDSPDGREGFIAFRERRPAQFSRGDR